MANTTTRIEGGFITVTIGANPIAANKRITLHTDGTYIVAGTALAGEAVLDEPGTTGEIKRAKLRKSEGTQLGIASEAITVGAGPLYAEANGDVGLSGSVIVGSKAKTAAAAPGDVFEYFPAN